MLNTSENMNKSKGMTARAPTNLPSSVRPEALVVEGAIVDVVVNIVLEVGAVVDVEDKVY